MAVALPFKRPVILVVRVMAGVVVAVATVHANPLALATETDVTVHEPDPGVYDSKAVSQALRRTL